MNKMVYRLKIISIHLILFFNSIKNNVIVIELIDVAID